MRLGKLSRGGSSRVETKALDHDFYDETITPFGLFLPENNQTYLYMNETFTSSDFIVDCIEDFGNPIKIHFQKSKSFYSILIMEEKIAVAEHNL
ncbi:MAG: hypothetical protein Q9M36_10795 [Sulfurovum sp.]|nr:hypothetical protein [Sulfurovum sp.]